MKLILVWNSSKKQVEFSKEFSVDSLKELLDWIEHRAMSVITCEFHTFKYGHDFHDVPRLKECLDRYENLCSILFSKTLEKRLDDVNSYLYQFNLPFVVTIADFPNLD